MAAGKRLVMFGEAAVGADSPMVMIWAHVSVFLIVYALIVIGIGTFAWLLPLFVLGIVIGVLRLWGAFDRLWPLS